MGAPGVLLIHGFTSHRSSMEVLLPELDRRGLEWHYPILAGHGTSPEDLRDTRWPDWQRDAESAFQYLRQAHEQVVIVALSMGSLLGLELAAKHPDHVSGLVLIAPCLRFKATAAKFTPIVTRVLKKFPNAPSTKFSQFHYATKDRGYSWFPTGTFRSYWNRTKKMSSVIQSVRQPVRIIHSRVDMIADPRGAQEIYDLLPGPKEILWHETSGHEMLLDAETNEVVQEILDFSVLKNL